MRHPSRPQPSHACASPPSGFRHTLSHPPPPPPQHITMLSLLLCLPSFLVAPPSAIQRVPVQRVATPTTSPPLFTLFDATPDPYAHCDRPGPPRPGYNFVASTPCCLANSSCGQGRDRCTSKPTVRRHGVKALSSYVPDVSTSSSLLTVTARSTHRQRQHTKTVSPARSRTARGRAAGRASSPRRRRPTARRAPRKPGPPARRGPRRP